jgi:hypothetical protein
MIYNHGPQKNQITWFDIQRWFSKIWEPILICSCSQKVLEPVKSPSTKLLVLAGYLLITSFRLLEKPKHEVLWFPNEKKLVLDFIFKNQVTAKRYCLHYHVQFNNLLGCLFFPRQALSIAAMVTEIEHRVPLKRAGLPSWNCRCFVCFSMHAQCCIHHWTENLCWRWYDYPWLHSRLK